MNIVERIKPLLLPLFLAVMIGHSGIDLAAQCTRFVPSASFSIETELSNYPEQGLNRMLISRSLKSNDLKSKLRKKGILLVASGIQRLEEKKENTRLVAAALTVALGPFGAHRLYLGTVALVPVFYTVTLGGGLGILPVIDLFHILFTKDLSRYYNHPGVFMWGGAQDTDRQ